MKPTPFLTFCRLLPLAVVCAVCPALADQQLSLLEGRCVVTVPDGWRTGDGFGDDGLVLHPPDPRAWPVELVIWPIPAGAAQTAGAAAAAHESVIQRTYPYTRRDSSPFTTAGGLRGLQVTAEVQTPSGRSVAAIFVAFATESHYCVVGTFSLPERLDAARSDLLHPVAYHLRLGNTRDLTTVPPATATPAEPTEMPAISPSTPPVRPRYDPASTPPAADRQDAPLQLLADEHLTLRAPANWQLHLEDGRWTVRPSGVQAHALGLLLWPLVFDGPRRTAAEMARMALEQWPPAQGRSFQFRPHADGATAVFTGTVSAPAGPLRLVGTCTADGSSALLSAMFVADGRAADDWPRLLDMLATVRIGALAYRRPAPATQTYRWRPLDLPQLSLPIPDGWMVRGRVELIRDRWTISIEATDPGPQRLYICWKQPLMPLFRQLSDLLLSMGYKPMDRYSASPGQPSYTLLARTDPEQFILQYAGRQARLALTDARLLESDQPRQLNALLEADDVESLQATLTGNSVLGTRRNHYLVALASAPADGRYAWQAAVLEAAGPDHNYLPAMHALQAMVRGAAFDDPAAPADARLADMIHAAQQAVSVLPKSAAQPADAQGPLQAPLTMLSPDGPDHWQCPSAALQLWLHALQARQDSRPAEDILPELSTMQD